MNPYVAPNGMTFKPPEANYNLQSLTQAIDMYNFGLITLLVGAFLCGNLIFVHEPY